MRGYYVYKILLFSLFLFAGQALYADNDDKFKTEQKSTDKFFRFVFRNPANMTYFSDFSHREISAGYIYDHNKSGNIAQHGNRRYLFGLNVSSYVNKSKSSFWGFLDYTKGKKYNIRWTQTSDYDLLYPYVIAASSSIDLHSENYSFKGGYSGIFGKYLLGIYARYDAEYEYSQADPRPRNTISKYSIGVGVSRQLGSKYITGLSLEAEPYKQKNYIRMYHDFNKMMFYFMRGFGLYNDMFSKTSEGVLAYYDGLKTGINWQLFPSKGRGWYSAVNTNIFSFDLDGSTGNYNTFFSMNIIRADANIAYRFSKGSNEYGIKVFSSFVNKAGTEHTYDNVSFANYDLAFKKDKYSATDIAVGISGIAGLNTGNNVINIETGFSLSDCLKEYNGPKYKDETTNFNIRLSADTEFTFNESRLRIELKGRYTGNISESADFPNALTVEGIKEGMLEHNHDFMKADKTEIGLHYQYSYCISADKEIFVRGHQSILKLSDKKANSFSELSIGLKF